VVLLVSVLFPWSYLHAQDASPATTSQKSSTQANSGSAATSSANFDELARKAGAARQQDQTKEAINFYNGALSLRPDWIEGWWYIGTLYAASDQSQLAGGAFQKVVEARPEFGPGWASLGLVEYQASNFGASYKSLLRARELGFQAAPQLEETANYHLALLLNQNGRFEDAWELLSSDVDQNEYPPRVRIGLALAMLRIPLLPEQISPEKDALLDMASETAVALLANRYERALQLFQRMLRDYPDTPFLHYAYGSALDFHQQFEDAEKQLREQVRLTPQSAIAHVRLGAVLVKLHRPADALAIAQRAVQLDPGSETAYKLLVRILTDLGRSQDAAHEAELAPHTGQETYKVDREVVRIYKAPSPGEGETPNNELTDDPSGLDTSASFSELAAFAEQERIAGHTLQAIQSYRAALRTNPHWAQGWTNLGIVLYASNRYANSINALIQSLSIDRSQADGWVFLGLAEFEVKDYQNSYIHLERGRRLGFHGTDEAKKIATDRLSQLRTLNGDFEGSLDLMTSALETSQLTPPMKLVMGMALLRVPNLASQVDPSKSEILQAVGQTAALLRQQKYDEAFRGFDQLLKSNPDTPFLHYAYGSALQTFSRFDEATRQFQEEIRITPASALPHMRLALIALTLHHPENAETSAQRAIVLDPDAAGGHELLGRARLDLGKVDDAIRELELAEQLAPTYPEVHFDLARAYAKAKKTDQAERERAIFASMSNVSEHEGAQRGNNAYGSPHDSSISERQTVKLDANAQ
jgi:tetratricopeptide (TPR) repeat protein